MAQIACVILLITFVGFIMLIGPAVEWCRTIADVQERHGVQNNCHPTAELLQVPTLQHCPPPRRAPKGWSDSEGWEEKDNETVITRNKTYNKSKDVNILNGGKINTISIPKNSGLYCLKIGDGQTKFGVGKNLQRRLNSREYKTSIIDKCKIWIVPEHEIYKKEKMIRSRFKKYLRPGFKDYLLGDYFNSVEKFIDQLVEIK